MPPRNAPTPGEPTPGEPLRDEPLRPRPGRIAPPRQAALDRPPRQAAHNSPSPGGLPAPTASASASATASSASASSATASSATASPTVSMSAASLAASRARPNITANNGSVPAGVGPTARLGWFAFVRGHFQRTRGPLAFGLAVAILLAPLLSLLRPAVGRVSLAATGLGLAALAAILGTAYLVSTTKLYLARSDRRLHDDESSGLSVLAWWCLWLAIGIGPVTFAEWHAPPQGWLVEFVPELHEEQVRWLGVARRIEAPAPAGDSPSDAPNSAAPVVNAPLPAPTASTPSVSTPSVSTPSVSTPTASTPTASTPTASTPTASTPTASTPTASIPSAIPTIDPRESPVAPAAAVGQAPGPPRAADPTDTSNPFELEDEATSPATGTPSRSSPKAKAGDTKNPFENEP
jgi:hypothetical protein